MISLDQAAGTTRTPPDAVQPQQTAAHRTRKGRPTVIILERDGSLHHYPPGHTSDVWRHATIDIHEVQAQPNIIERILDFTFDVLGISNLEMRIHEHPKR